jgi:hypothetical protein
MTESNPRAPEVQTICLRPLDVAAVLYKYRPKRPGEVIDEDAWPPGYGCLPDPPAAARGNGSAAAAYFSSDDFKAKPEPNGDDRVDGGDAADALAAAVASFGPLTTDRAERLWIWLKNNPSEVTGRVLDKTEMDRSIERAIEFERATHPGKEESKGFDESSYGQANGGGASRQYSELNQILGNIVPIERQEAGGASGTE